MISRIKGRLEGDFSSEESVMISVGDIGYEVLLPGYLLKTIGVDAGKSIELFTFHYMEGSMGGNTLIPRLVGFSSLAEKAFFQRFITVPGIGIRKALKALTISYADVAAAIEKSDVKFLIALPEIGKRTAEKIVAELKGRMTEWALSAGTAPITGTPAPTGALTGSEAEHEAMAVLISLGHKSSEAEELIARVIANGVSCTSAEELIQEVYKMKKKA